jgi:hypothetical protein
MQGMLCLWALAIQEYDFTIVYRKGSENGNADALSRRNFTDMELVSVTTAVTLDRDDEIRTHQKTDPTISAIHRALIKNQPPSKRAPPHLINRYRQIWHQLVLNNDIVCRKYIPSPSEDMVTVPILPPALRQEALRQNHDAPMAGHQGVKKPYKD